MVRGVAAAVAQHVGMNQEIEACAVPNAFNHPIIRSDVNWPAAKRTADNVG
jgi:hypothetical protein